MSSDIRDRLKRLGVHQGAAHLKPRARDEQIEVHTDAPLVSAHSDAPLWNMELATEAGPVYMRRTSYPLDHQHGASMLRHAFAYPPDAVARLNGGRPVNLNDALFIDTETTGLVGGAGTLVFLIGVGYLVDDDRLSSDRAGHLDGVASPSFVVDQYFLTDPNVEYSMLVALDQVLNQHTTLVTFNGRGFDVPMLENRFTLSSIPSVLGEKTHLDLLLPARRTWRDEYGSCSLNALEHHVLSVVREQQDIAGFLIPQLYREYLESGDTTEMHRVLYHNVQDVLSMVALASRLCSAMQEPIHVGEHLALGAYYEAANQLERAETVYRAALTHGQVNQMSYRRALLRLTALLKRQNRRSEAVPCWQELGEYGEVEALIEIAKHFEWHDVNMANAITYAERALTVARDPLTRSELRHRLQRLRRKQDGADGSAPRRKGPE